jgi:hypothetical protein
MSEVYTSDTGEDNFLTRKIGPLPAWGWLLVGVGGYFIYKKYGSSLLGGSSSSDTTSDNTGAQDTTLGTTGSIDTPNDSLVAIETSLTNLTAMAQTQEKRQAKNIAIDTKQTKLLNKILKRLNKTPTKTQTYTRPKTTITATKKITNRGK